LTSYAFRGVFVSLQENKIAHFSILSIADACAMRYYAKHMEHIKSDVESFARIRVVGVGGSGNNAVNHMVNAKVKGVEFVAINSDAQDLHHSQAKRKIHIGKNITKGLGAGGNPDMGRRAAEETKEEIANALKGSHMTFITGGMGGGTGTGAAPIVAKASRDLGALTIGVVTKPFLFEGQERMRSALEGIEELKKEVDALIIIPNDRLLAIIDKNTTIQQAFGICDEVLRQAVVGISDLITMPGIVNLDFADIRSVMENAGSALMGVGIGAGEKRAEDAARMAINSPLLEVSITGARGVLFAVAGGDDLGMLEVQEAARIITESVDPHARIIFGAFKDDTLKKNELKITVIATGFPESDSALKRARDAQSDRVMQPMTVRHDPYEQGATRDQFSEPEEEVRPAPPRSIFNTVMPRPRREEAPAPEPTKAPEFIEQAPAPAPLRPVPEAVEEPVSETERPWWRNASQNSSPNTNYEDDENDEWGAVPSFLRRTKGQNE